MAFTIYTDGSFRPESMTIKHPSRQEEEKVTLEQCSVEEVLYKVIGYLESNNRMN